MTASRGRMGQYKILQTDPELSKHLVETELFSKASLFVFMDKYKTILIKPVFGSGDIYVTREKDTFLVISNHNRKIVLDKASVYRFLVDKELKQKYYIITPVKQNSLFFQNAFQYFVTVHRDPPSSNWFITSKTEKIHSAFGRFFYMYFLKKIENLSLLAAKKLEEYFPNCNTIVIEIMYDLKGGIWIQDTILHYSISKWEQYQSLISNHSLLSFIPETDLLTKVSFEKFLNKYSEIIIKPCVGQNGIGIVQITTNDFIFEIHSGNKKITKSTLEETYSYIEATYLSKKNYIIQQRISLATINDCPLDIRVIAQKVESGWEITGKIVKVAGSNFFVTNAAQKLLLLEVAIHDSNVSTKDVDALHVKMDELCLAAAKHLEENNRENITIIGFDIGITPNMNLWIIEGNYTPDLSMFLYLENKNIYKEILNKKRNGRR